MQLHAIFHGRVQGVGFRWTVVECAEKHHLVGTTKNLPNGTVEVIAQGAQEDLENFLATVKNCRGSVQIAKIETSYEEKVSSFTGFTIVY